MSNLGKGFAWYVPAIDMFFLNKYPVCTNFGGISIKNTNVL